MGQCRLVPEEEAEEGQGVTREDSVRGVVQWPQAREDCCRSNISLYKSDYLDKIK
jgi:hypothetical protein